MAKKVLFKRTTRPDAPSIPDGAVTGELFLNIASGTTARNRISTKRIDGSAIEWSDDVANEKKFAPKTKPSSNEIWYTTTDGQPLNNSSCEGYWAYLESINSGWGFDLTIVSNTYENGIGKLVLSHDINDTGLSNGYGLFSYYHSYGYYSFDCGFDRLETIILPDVVTSIGDNAFYNCSRLKSVNITGSVTSIGVNAFAFCHHLTSVYCKAVTPPTLSGTSVFDSNASERKIYVPIESVDAYKSATNWSEYADYIVGCVFEDENLVSGENIKTINGESILGSGNIEIGINQITYSELKTKRDNGLLIPGTWYRITDYVTTTTQENTSSAGHQFDIIVVADTNAALNEIARACLHEGDTYFVNSDLSAWELKYCLDNDTNRFAWADATNGKGVIYYMKDEWNNECPYDFKNVIYLEVSTFECSRYGRSYTYTMNGDIITIGGINYYGYERIGTTGGPYTPTTPLYVTETTLSTSMTLYTINGEVASPYTSVSIVSVENKDEELYTFGGTSDLSVETSTIYSNIISPYFVQSIQTLNRNTFGNNCNNNSFGNDCYSNSFGNYCQQNSFGECCNSNSFGNYCQRNSFGNSCNDNSFGDRCYGNSFGNDCDSNSFGNDCDGNSFGYTCDYNSFGDNCNYNSFGNSCYRNSFGNSCYYNSFGNYCAYNSFISNCYTISFGNNCQSNSFGDSCGDNSFGNNCYSNSFGNYCINNSFGNYCYYHSFGECCYSNSFGNDCRGNSFGNDENNLKHYYRYNSFGDGCQYINLANDETSSYSNCVQNYKFAQGLQGTSSSPLTINAERNRVYETKVAKNSAGDVKVYCEADLIA